MASDGPITVLIVEDNALSLLLLQEQLAQLGAAVVAARSGTLAASLLDDVTPDLVITDINMPGMSGYDLLRLIRARHPQMRVYAISASLPSADATAQAACVFTGYLLKPVTLSQLAKVVDLAIGEPPSRPKPDHPGPGFPGLQPRHLHVLKQQMRDDLKALERLRNDQRLPALVDWLHGVSGGLACIGASGLLDLCNEVRAEAQEATQWNSGVDELLAAFCSEWENAVAQL